MEINLSVECQRIDDDFRRIACDLMNNWIINVEHAKYRITEIEFYYKNEFHNDPYVHGNQLQKEKGKWYFHGSGIDLTFGNEKTYGGILIRAIFDINNKKYYYGPLNCILELFSNLSSIYETKISFGLTPAEENQLEFEKPISAPRVGLNPKIDDGMVKKNYRFLIMPKQKHAEKTLIAEAMKSQEYPEDEIKNIWG